jgi:hypothetical protein
MDPTARQRIADRKGVDALHGRVPRAATATALQAGTRTLAGSGS